MAVDNRTLDPIYWPLTVVTPPGTLPTAVLATNVGQPHGWLEQIDLQIPSGHAGVTGIRVVLNGIALLPYATPSQWIIGDDLHEVFDVPIEVDTGLRVNTYNTGQFPHTHLMRFKIRQLPASAGIPTVPLVSAATLNG
jgi:hypothetical protein